MINPMSVQLRASTNGLYESAALPSESDRQEISPVCVRPMDWNSFLVHSLQVHPALPCAPAEQWDDVTFVANYCQVVNRDVKTGWVPCQLAEVTGD